MHTHVISHCKLPSSSTCMWTLFARMHQDETDGAPYIPPPSVSSSLMGHLHTGISHSTPQEEYEYEYEYLYEVELEFEAMRVPQPEQPEMEAVPTLHTTLQEQTVTPFPALPEDCYSFECEFEYEAISMKQSEELQVEMELSPVPCLNVPLWELCCTMMSPIAGLFPQLPEDTYEFDDVVEFEFEYNYEFNCMTFKEGLQLVDSQAPHPGKEEEDEDEGDGEEIKEQEDAADEGGNHHQDIVAKEEREEAQPPKDTEETDSGHTDAGETCAICCAETFIPAPEAVAAECADLQNICENCVCCYTEGES